MDHSSGGRPPSRRELQGPRPAPLKVTKESHKIKKPPVAPQPHHHQPPPTQQPPRPPVIIYAVSPKIIHTNPGDFMTLVQRLTGPDNSASASTTRNPPPSPAARFAAMEKTRTPPESKNITDTTGYDERFPYTRPGSSVLSPGPAGLTRPVPPAFFSDPISPLVNLYHQHQHNHLNIALQQIQYSGGGNDYHSNLPTTPSAAAGAALFSPNPMLSPASIEFLRRLLDQ